MWYLKMMTLLSLHCCSTFSWRQVVSFIFVVEVVDGLTTSALSSSSSDSIITRHRHHRNHNHSCAVVIGKIIIDEYKDPTTTNNEGDESRPPVISVGGGGPQAAFGAAAALAVLDVQQEQQEQQSKEENNNNNNNNDDDDIIPPKQPVIFLGPIGNMSIKEKESLYEMLTPAISTICLIEDETLQTPKIQLWHDSNQDLKWFPLEDSWSSKGADSLWRNRPSASDVLQAVVSTSSSTTTTTTTTTTKSETQTPTDNGNDDDNSNKKLIDSLFLIMETSKDSPGGGEDSQLLADQDLRKSTNIIGIEPIAFPDETTGKLPLNDLVEFQTRIDKLQSIDVITPDKYLFESMVDMESSFWNDYRVAARYGEEGSRIFELGGTNSKVERKIPIATLKTSTGQVVNPTGAGNAYSSAFVTCLGQGLSMIESACIATAVGASVCEYPNLPPWTYETIYRIYDGSQEVKQKLLLL